MGCRWKTVDGKRVRFDTVKQPRSALSIITASVANLLFRIGLTFVHASPELTLEELREATLTLWHDPELGYFIQAKMSPSAPSIYHSITTAEATAFEAGRYSGSFIARMFHPVDPAANSN
jgi:hypothetical protein